MYVASLPLRDNICTGVVLPTRVLKLFFSVQLGGYRLAFVAVTTNAGRWAGTEPSPATLGLRLARARLTARLSTGRQRHETDFSAV